MALDRETISEQLYGGFAPPHVQPFAEGLVGYDPEVGSGVYDVDAAKALIQEAGAEEATISLLAQTNNDLLNQVIQQQLGEIGLNVELDVVSPTEGYSTWYYADLVMQASSSRSSVIRIHVDARALLHRRECSRGPRP